MQALKGAFFDNTKALFEQRVKGAELCIYDSIGSTNTEAKEYAESHVGKDKVFFIARSQSAGRGRLGRSFLSCEGGLYFSYLSHPTISCEESLLLTVFSAVCLCETIEQIVGAKPGIKWVNDVFLCGKKVAGILTEGAVCDDGKALKWAVVGIGLNVSRVDFPEELVDIATDIESAVGIKPDISLIAATLAEKLSSFSPSLRSEYMKKYRERLIVIGKRVRVTSAAGEYYALVEDVDDDGALRVVKDCGEQVRLISGEISIRM